MMEWETMRKVATVALRCYDGHWKKKGGVKTRLTMKERDRKREEAKEENEALNVLL
jgi:hypothetical protein